MPDTQVPARSSAARSWKFRLGSGHAVECPRFNRTGRASVPACASLPCRHSPSGRQNDVALARDRARKAGVMLARDQSSRLIAAAPSARSPPFRRGRHDVLVPGACDAADHQRRNRARAASCIADARRNGPAALEHLARTGPRCFRSFDETGEARINAGQESAGARRAGIFAMRHQHYHELDRCAGNGSGPCRGASRSKPPSRIAVFWPQLAQNVWR